MKRLQKKHPLAIRWFHWLNFPLLAVMIWSGLLIYWANPVYGVPVPAVGRVNLPPEKILVDKKGNGIDLFAPVAPGWVPKALITTNPNNDKDHTYPPVLYDLTQRLAEGMGWHFFFMWFFTINGLLYVLYTVFSGEWKLLLPGKGALKNAWLTILHDMYLRKESPPQIKYNGAQQITYSLIIFMGVGSVLTGLAIYRPTQAGWLTWLFGGYGAARFIHFWLMMGYVGFFTIHILQVIKTGWNNFRGMITGHELVTETPASDSGMEVATNA
ncbi:MAG TPA: cytochrome b/b6 domain-containing protein [Fimbriimonadaceae bacterium]|jgi:thiosulfate reductase cytochrome b subunit